MPFESKNIIVTGGAGFIGSHIVDRLLAQKANVTVIDNMHTGQQKVVEGHRKNKNYKLARVDIFKEPALLIKEMKNIDFVFHAAANADIRNGIKNTRVDLEQNTIATCNVLEAMRLNDVKGICFTSSAAVYGEQKSIPTPEDTPKVQNSLYGASKLACEALIEAFSFYYGFRHYMYRFVSIVGERYPHGVVIDFVNKLKKDPKKLEILGNGRQKKSFLYINDCIKGIFTGIERSKNQNNVFNLGHDNVILIDKVADLVINGMGLEKVERYYTGGEVGWLGDQPMVLLSTERIKALGWKPEISIEDGIRRTVKFLLEK